MLLVQNIFLLPWAAVLCERTETCESVSFNILKGTHRWPNVDKLHDEDTSLLMYNKLTTDVRNNSETVTQTPTCISLLPTMGHYQSSVQLAVAIKTCICDFF